MTGTAPSRVAPTRSIIVPLYCAAFDLELLVVAHHLDFSRVVEAPVRIVQRFSGTVNR